MPSTYTFSTPTGKPGRPRHVTFISHGDACLALGLSPETINQLIQRRQKQSHGIRFIGKTYAPRAVNAYRAGPRGHDPLPVRLQHLDTGRVIEAPSIVAFSREARLGPNGRFHVTPVLKGEKLSFKGWALPEVINAELPLKDVFGNTYSKTVGEWTRHLSTCTLNRLRAGRAVGALAPVAHSFGEILPVKTHKVISYTFRKGYSRGRGRPSVTAPTLIEAAAKLGISAPSAFDLAHGYRPSVRGATFVKATTEARRVLDVAQS